MWLWRTIARSPLLSGMTDGDEVERPVHVGVGGQLEVRGADRRNEAVVERLGDSQRWVDPAPAELVGDLLGSQLAGVEEAEDLDLGEMRRQQLVVLADV